MLFGKKRPVTVTFIDAHTKAVIGQDEVLPHLIPVDFDYPTQVEIDGSLYELKAADPADRKQARKTRSMTAWVELLPRPASEEQTEETTEESEASSAVPPAQAYFRTASIAEPQPRFSGTRGEYRFLELLPSDWRAVEFIQRQYAPEVGEELSHILQVQQSAAQEIDGKPFYSEQYIRSLTSLPLRSLEIDDIGLQTRFFPLGTRLDGVAIMGANGYVHAGFAYRLHSGLGFYGQEIDNKLRSLGLMVPMQALEAEAIAEDIVAITAMMKALELILVDWNRLEAVEADPAELAAFIAARTQLNS